MVMEINFYVNIFLKENRLHMILFLWNLFVCLFFIDYLKIRSQSRRLLKNGKFKQSINFNLTKQT